MTACRKPRISVRRSYARINPLRAELGVRTGDRTRHVDHMLDNLARAIATIGHTARGQRVSVRYEVAALVFAERARLELLASEVARRRVA